MLVWAVDTLLHKYPPPPSSTLPYLHHHPVGLSRWWHSDGTMAYKMHTLQLYANVVSLYHCITYRLRIWNCWAGRWYSDRARQHWHIATGCAFYMSLCHCYATWYFQVHSGTLVGSTLREWDNTGILIDKHSSTLTILQWITGWYFIDGIILAIYAISHIISTCCYLLLAYIDGPPLLSAPKAVPEACLHSHER